MRRILVVLLLSMVVAAASADLGAFSSGQRELGPIVVHELSVRNGVLSFRAESGGCTDATSFAIDVVREEGLTAQVPHFRLTIRRVRPDDCKALLWDGALIELDLAADLGITGLCTISVENPVYQEIAGNQ